MSNILIAARVLKLCISHRSAFQRTHSLTDLNFEVRRLVVFDVKTTTEGDASAAVHSEVASLTKNSTVVNMEGAPHPNARTRICTSFSRVAARQ